MLLTTPYSLLQSNKTGGTLLSSSNEHDLVSDSPVQPARDGDWIDEQDNVMENPKAKACAPADWKTNSEKYHAINIAIWELWIVFYVFLISQITVNGETIDPSLICGPWLPWHLPPGAKYVILILRYMPTSLANMIKGRQPSAATYANGTLVSATWQLLHLSLGKAYWSCAKINIIFCAFKYRGKLTDVYYPTTILNIMVEWSKFVMGVFSIEGIMIQICSRGVITDIIKHIFKGSEETFNEYWSKNKEKFFSLSTNFLRVPWHPECLLNGAIRAAYANGLQAISKLHDDAYSGVLLYLSANIDCTIAMQMFEEDANSPAYQLLILASQQALLRAQDIVKQASIVNLEGSTDIKKIPKNIRNVIIRWKSFYPDLQLRAVDECKKLEITDGFGKPPTPTKAYSLLKQYEAFMRHLPAIRLLAKDRRNWVDIEDGAGVFFRFSIGGENQQYVGTYEYINNVLQYASENDFRRKKLIDELNLRLDERSTVKSEIYRKASNELVSQAKEIQDSQLTNVMVGTQCNTVDALFALAEGNYSCP